MNDKKNQYILIVLIATAFAINVIVFLIVNLNHVTTLTPLRREKMNNLDFILCSNQLHIFFRNKQ